MVCTLDDDLFEQQAGGKVAEAHIGPGVRLVEPSVSILLDRDQRLRRGHLGRGHSGKFPARSIDLFLACKPPFYRSGPWNGVRSAASNGPLDRSCPWRPRGP